MGFDLQTHLDERQAAELYRTRRIVESGTGVQRTVDGSPCTLFCTNDYLGLAGDPRVIQAAQDAASESGVGSSAAPLVTGYHRHHRELEEELAALLNRDRVLLFSTGYLANLAVITSLVEAGDDLFEDELSHASLRDGRRLSGANRTQFPHCDPEALSSSLAASPAPRKLITTDGVFSMDGDCAPVRALATLARKYDAWLMVDDAHGIGVLGEHGGGLLEQEALNQDDVPVLIGTLGKAFGSSGAFVAGSESLIEFLIQRARPWIYSTAPAPLLSAAALTSLRIIQSEPERREKLRANIARFRIGANEHGLDLLNSFTSIQPLVLGSPGAALSWSRALEERGILVIPIRPPTVPASTSRLRISLSSEHTEEQIDLLLQALSEIRVELAALQS